MHYSGIPSAVLVLALVLAPSLAAGDVLLVENGEPKAAIVIPENANEIETLAAQELQAYVQKMSGAKLQIVTEAAAPAKGNVVAVGNTKLAAKFGVDVKKLPAEAFRLKTTGPRPTLIIAGQDTINERVSKGRTPFAHRNHVGTLFGTYALLHRLGVRWLWPGESGEVAPKMKTIRLTDLEVTESPRVRKRHLRGTLSSSWRRRLKGVLKISRQEWNARNREWLLWYRRNGLGSNLHMKYGHAFRQWYKLYFKDHPDWFAMQEDSRRGLAKRQKPDRIKLCTSNPEIDDRIFADYLEARKRWASLKNINACPNDGSHGYCQCPKCKALDAPGAMVNHKGRLVPSLADRHLNSWNRLARKAVKKFGPDISVVGYAYNKYRAAPMREKVHPNLLIGFVGLTYLNDVRNERERKLWKAWADASDPKLPGKHTMFLRPNFLGGFFGMPFIYVHKMGPDIRMCYENRMVGTDFDTSCQHWATEGVNYYVLARLLWDPTQKVDDILNDYLAKAFGPAAEPMKRYFAHYEKRTSRIAVTIDETKIRHRFHRYEFIHRRLDPALFRQADGMLKQARAAAKSNADVLKRIEFVATGLEYARMQAAIMRAAHRARKSRTRQDALRKLIQKKIAFYNNLKNPWAINVSLLKWREPDRKYARLFGNDLAGIKAY